MDAYRVFGSWILWFEPGAGSELHYPRHDVFTEKGARQAAAALIEKPHDIAVRYSTGRGVGWMDTDGLPVHDLGGTAEITIVQLTVQALIWLIADEMQRIEVRIVWSFHSGWIPARMTLAVIVTETLNGPGRNLDLS